ncbi:hypothetical protein Acr_16g0004150 [Actinidia rufa]|uniref:Uncharacterized protein n=1 Tax=Actinidia rufa TaxID=165716 RepID=A0A7J0FYL6_9ERIC|nr:hypothetical protein Acr_16g0004150 [Actinidia rufa]
MPDLVASSSTLSDFHADNHLHARRNLQSTIKEVEKACREAIFFAIIWSLWKARNELIFSNVNIVKAELIDLIKLRVAFWVKAKCDINEYSVVDIQRCLDGISSIRRAKSATLC